MGPIYIHNCLKLASNVYLFIVTEDLKKYKAKKSLIGSYFTPPLTTAII